MTVICKIPACLLVERWQNCIGSGPGQGRPDDFWVVSRTGNVGVCVGGGRAVDSDKKREGVGDRV